MIASISAKIPTKIPTEEAAPAPSENAAEFKSIMANAKPEDTAAAPVPAESVCKPVSDKHSLEELLSAVMLTLTPDSSAQPGTIKKASARDKLPLEKDSEAEDGKDPAATLLAALGLPRMLIPTAQGESISQARRPTVHFDGKSASEQAAPLTGIGDLGQALAPALPLNDLTALIDAPRVNGPDAPAPIVAHLDRLIDTARDAAWLDRLSSDIAESAVSGDKMRFRMMPPNLGMLDVSVERQVAGVSVNMTTHSPEARNLIADSRQQMVDGLKAQGVPLVQFSLAAAGEDQAGHHPPRFFNHLIESAVPAGTSLAAQPVDTVAERMGRFA